MVARAEEDARAAADRAAEATVSRGQARWKAGTPCFKECFATPEEGRYIDPEVAAAARAPARRMRAAPGAGLQRNYHKDPAFGGEKRCGEPGADHPGPCRFNGGVTESARAHSFTIHSYSFFIQLVPQRCWEDLGSSLNAFRGV